MTTQRIRTALGSFGVGLLATTAFALAPSLGASPAGADDQRPACTKESPSGSSDKKCPSPSPSASPTSSGPTGTEVGCRDITYGGGQYKVPDPGTGSVLEFQLTVAAASCPEVTYTIIARDMDNLAELGRSAQEGNGLTADLFAVFHFPNYVKDAVAVDVIVSEGDVVHDVAPNSRDEGVQDDVNRFGSGPQSWN